MKDILSAVVDELSTLDLLPAADNCFVTPDQRWWPDNVTGTRIGVMNGGVVREELAGEVWEETATVELIGFVPLVSDAEAAICGTSGVLQLLDDAVDELKENLLSISGMQRVRIGNDRNNGLHQEVEGNLLVSVIRQVIYTIERSSV